MVRARVAPHAWAVRLLLLTAVAIRAASLPGRSWWIDELITRDVARLPLWTAESLTQQRPPFASILAFCVHDTGPGPLTYLLDGLFAAWAEPMGGEFWMRIPAIAASVLTVLLLLTGGRHLTGTRAGAFAMAAGVAFMPAMVDYGTTPRGYAWAVLLGLLHLTALVRGILAAQRRRGTVAWSWWIVAAASGCAAVMVHAVSLIWVTACLVAAVTAPQGGARAWRLGAMTAALGVAVVTAAWFMHWLPGLTATPNPMPAARSVHEIIGHLAAPLDALVEDGTVILFAVATAMIWSGRERGSGKMVVTWRAVWLSLILSAVLALTLAYKFFLAPRHLFPAQMALLLLLGIHTGPALRRFARLTNALRARLLAAGMLALVSIAALPFALRSAITPMQDWRSAIRGLTAGYQPGDMILCGPNSDLEILKAYAGAAGIDPGAVPRWIDDGSDQLADTSSEDGVRAALASPARIWFITGFYGQLRPASYWALVEGHFRRVGVTSTGRLPVVLLVHEPSDKSL